MLDVDGTLIGVERRGLPSPRVRHAIEQVRDKIHVGIATGRPLHEISYLLTELSLSGPCIINGGIQIVDAASQKVLKEQRILPADILAIAEIAKKLTIQLDIVEHGHDARYYDGYPVKTPLGIFTEALDESVADILIESISHIPTISFHKTSSWFENKMHVGINHAAATKQHGILEVAEILSIPTEEIIGVGDHYNDFPLLIACGLKIAMGNAVEDLKAIADYIAPSVDEDGVADVIEKYILDKFSS